MRSGLLKGALKQLLVTAVSWLAIVTLFLLQNLPNVAYGSALLIHQYVFNGNANDQVGSANGTLLGGATVSGGLLSLNGSTAYVQFGSHIVPEIGSFSVTLFAQETAPTGGYIEFISQGFSGGPGFYLGHNPGGVIRASDAWISTGVPFPSDGKRHHYALVVDSTADQAILYVDGVRRAATGAFSTTGSGTDTRLGRQFDPFAEFFNGSLSDVRIYQGALTSAEVADLAMGAIQFAAFKARGEIDAAAGVFEVSCTFTLGAGGSFSPFTQDLTVQLAGFSTTIPRGSFRQTKRGRFVFEGVVNGVPLEAKLTPRGGSGFSLKLEGAGAPNLPNSNPVTLKLTAGSNAGTTTVRAEFEDDRPSADR